MKKTVYCAALCIMQHAAYGIFNAVPGDQIWVMVDQIGRTNQAIKGFATPISNADLPLNITVSGRYAAVEPLSYTPANATDYPITIDADNVHLTLNGYTLNVGNTTANAIIVVSGRNNISIVDGAINGGDGIQFDGSHNGITVDNFYLTCGTFASAAVDIIGPSTNISVSNIRANGLVQSVLDGVAITDSTNIRVSNCSFENYTGGGLFFIRSNTATAENISSNNSIAGIGFNTVSNIYLNNCSTQAGVTGGYVFNELCEHVVFNNCSSVGNNSGIITQNPVNAFSFKNFRSYGDNIGIDIAGTSSMITIEDTTIELATINGIHFGDNINYVTLQNVDIIRPGSVAILCDLGSTENGFIFKNLNLIDLSAAGISFATLTNFVLKNSSLIAAPTAPSNAMIFFSNISNAVLKNNTLLGNTAAGGGILVNTCVDTCILDSQISDVTQTGLDFLDTSTLVIANCTVNNNQFGINITNGGRCAIRNCILNDSSFNGISCTNITLSAITNNNINFNTTGIGLSTCTNSYVGFNTIAMSGTAPTTPTNLGIIETGPASNAFFGNMIQNYDSGTGGGASTMSFYTSSPFHCNPNVPVNDPVPNSHWENLQIIYN